MAGEITTTLLARVRTNLDESSAGFWTDVECYKALTDGQRESINFVLAIFQQKQSINPEEPIPQVLRVLQATATGTGTTSLPSGFLYPLSVYTSTTPVYIRPDKTKGATKVNTYMTSSSAQPYCSINATQIVFETSVSWSFEHLITPANDIDATHDPTLGYLAYDAIVEYATAFLLMKDENPRSQQHLQKFFSIIQNLVF